MNEKVNVNSQKCKVIKSNVEEGIASKHAITLISLVITIVVLIILASVGIYLSLGNNGIFTRAKQAKEVTNKQEATDIMNLKITNCQINKYAEKQEMPTLKELSEVLRDDSEIQYVTEESKVASAEYDVPSKNPTSIYTKLNKYPYEFEINAQLQLASINGVKVASTTTNDILFEGTTSEGCEITLNKQLSNYSYIEIYSRNVDDYLVTNPILKFQVEDLISHGILEVYSSHNAWTYSSMYSYNSSKNSLKNESNFLFGATGEVSENYYGIEIYKIVGIK